MNVLYQAHTIADFIPRKMVIHQETAIQDTPACHVRSSRLKVIIVILTGEGLLRGSVHLSLVLSKESLVDLGLRRSKGRGSNEFLTHG
jgi:hypothetical protein